VVALGRALGATMAPEVRAEHSETGLQEAGERIIENASIQGVAMDQKNRRS